MKLIIFASSLTITDETLKKLQSKYQIELVPYNPVISRHYTEDEIKLLVDDFDDSSLLLGAGPYERFLRSTPKIMPNPSATEEFNNFIQNSKSDILLVRKFPKDILKLNPKEILFLDISNKDLISSFGDDFCDTIRHTSIPLEKLMTDIKKRVITLRYQISETNDNFGTINNLFDNRVERYRLEKSNDVDEISELIDILI